MMVLTSIKDKTREHIGCNYKGVTMNNFLIAISIIGGLALFIYGMNLMSDGMQKTAGDRMHKLLALLTSNPLFGVFAGALVAAVLQSSSATTLMTVGFVGAGLMKLPQAISVIMGANIGATLTAQLIAFQLGDYAWIFVIVGFIMYFGLKKWEVVHNIGQVLFGFGLLFVSMNIMSNAMMQVAESAYLAHLMVQVEAWPLMGTFMGAILTFAIQSSTAGIALLQSMASAMGPNGVTGIIGLTASVPIIFGFNIGTTVLALISTRKLSVNAKRAALFHCIFNITATLIFIWFIPQIVQLISSISPAGASVDVISRQIANTHLLFNVVSTILFLPFIGAFVKLVTFIIPGEDVHKLKTETMYLDNKALHQPVFAIHLATQELMRIGGFALDMINKSKKAFIEDDMGLADEVLELENAVNQVQGMTVQYLAAILSSEAATETQAKRLSGLLHIAADIEHIGDYCKNLAEFSQEKNKNKYDFSDRAMAEICDFFDQSLWIMRDALSALEKGDESLARDVLVQEVHMNHTEERLRKEHMKRLYDSLCSPAFTVIYNDVIHNIEKIGDCCNNIAEAVLNDVGPELPDQPFDE